MIDDGTPFAEDCAITSAADAVGMDVQRSRSIVITDRRALKDAGLVKEGPDYARIRALLASDAEVKGAEFGPVEYILRRRNGVNRKEE